MGVGISLVIFTHSAAYIEGGERVHQNPPPLRPLVAVQGAIRDGHLAAAADVQTPPPQDALVHGVGGVGNDEEGGGGGTGTTAFDWRKTKNPKTRK